MPCEFGAHRSTDHLRMIAFIYSHAVIMPVITDKRKSRLDGVSLFSYSVGMGKLPIGPAGDFARKIADEILARTLAAGGDRSGRWLEERTNRGKDYWRSGFVYKKPFNTNDVEEAAKAFGVSPFELTRSALASRDATVTALRRDADLKEVASESITVHEEDTDDQYD